MAKFVRHLLDGLLGKSVGREVLFFRQLNHHQRYPICSGVTVFSYYRALHNRFGVTPECADPDEVDDWVSSHTEYWVRVLRLECS